MKWTVETLATFRRIYTVEAENEKDAIAKSCDASFDHEEDVTEETTSALPSTGHDSLPSPQEQRGAAE